MGDEEDLVMPGMVVRDRWKVIKKLGEGGFGAVFEVQDQQTRDSCALKIEGAKERTQVLKMEVAVLRRLQGKNHVCRFVGCGRNDRFNYVVMSLVGKNLSDLKKATKEQKFTVGTGIRVSFQCTRAIEDLHGIGFLHRDIKPGNFAVGRSRETQKVVYVLDFGLARQFVNSKGEIRTPRSAAGFRGTVRYAPIAAHRNKEMGRQDDLWCLLYMTVEFIVGQLPWRRIVEKEQVGRMKETISTSSLLRGCPEEMFSIHKHITILQYADRPDYQHIYGLMDRCLKRIRVKMDDLYDWEDPNALTRRKRGPRTGHEKMTIPGDEKDRTEDVEDPYGVPEAPPRRGRGR